MATFDISRETVFREYNKIKEVTGVSYSKKTAMWTIG